MADKVVSISKNDITQIIEVNKKAIELQSEVSTQNENVLEALEKLDKNIDKSNPSIFLIEKAIDKVDKNVEDIKNSLFKINVLLGSGILALILNIIQFLVTLKK